MVQQKLDKHESLREISQVNLRYQLVKDNRLLCVQMTRVADHKGSCGCYCYRCALVAADEDCD